MSHSSRVDDTSAAILARISSGEFAPGTRLPGQDELATLLGVSRLTVREAVKDLQAGRILRVEHGNGTYVNAVAAWTDLQAIAHAQSSSDALSTAQALVEVRRIIEVGAAQLAAGLRTEDDLELLRNDVHELESATRRGDLDDFVRHDLAFHAHILQACRNPYLVAIYEPLGRSLSAARRQTSAVDSIRQHALEQHRSVLAALEAGDPVAAVRAMDAHMDQTRDDLATYVPDVDA